MNYYEIPIIIEDNEHGHHRWQSITTAGGAGLIRIGPERCHDFRSTVDSFAGAQCPFHIFPAI